MQNEAQVAIVGGGPVGLLLAHILGRAGLNTLVLEKRTALPDWSRAIGITPPSLEILGRIGLQQLFLDHGVAIREVRVHRGAREDRTVVFSRAEDALPFILSHPQNLTQHHLEAALPQAVAAALHTGVTVTGLVQERDRVQVQTTQGIVEADWVVGCDGRDSTVRSLCHIPVTAHRYQHRFRMADFPDPKASPEGRLWFTPDGAVEAFPLPKQRRRWIVQLTGGPADISDLVAARTGRTLKEPLGPTHDFQPEFQLAQSFHTGRVFLAGDAAHICSPIGGQGMNCGFADAARLGRELIEVLEGKDVSEAGMDYHQARSKAFLRSARLARAGMWLGTRTRALHGIRSSLLAAMLQTPVLHNAIAKRFLMR